MRLICLIVIPFLLSGCGGYEIKNLAKSDVDLVADEFIDESRRLVRELTVKLYKRNPQELRKTPGMTIEGRLQQLRSTREELRFEELSYRQEVDALELVFNPHFSGDRVFALVVGLGGMLRNAYGYNPEFFIFDSLDGDKLLASAHIAPGSARRALADTHLTASAHTQSMNRRYISHGARLPCSRACPKVVKPASANDEYSVPHSAFRSAMVA